VPDNILLDTDNGAVNRDFADEPDPPLVPAQPAAGDRCTGIHSEEQQRTVQVSDEGRAGESEPLSSLFVLRLHVSLHRDDVICLM